MNIDKVRRRFVDGYAKLPFPLGSATMDVKELLDEVDRLTRLGNALYESLEDANRGYQNRALDEWDNR